MFRNIFDDMSNQHSYIYLINKDIGYIYIFLGLWIVDLSVTQLFLQTVKERERGLVSGVQNSLNQLMDMLKALMVILAPYPEEFGMLTFISFGFVCLGCLLYIKFLVSNRNVSYG